MSDELHTYIEPELEARITALVLGEASEFEVDDLKRLIKERPELALYQRRIQMMHDLVGAAIKPESDPAWQLSTGRRERLKAAFAEKDRAAKQPGSGKTMPGRRYSSTASAQWRAAISIAACLVVCLVIFSLMTPIYDKSAKYAAEADFVTYQAAEKDESSLVWNGMFDGKDASLSSSAVPMSEDKAVVMEGAGGSLATPHKSIVPRRSVVERKPSVPSSSMAKQIAANTPAEVPVPEIFPTTPASPGIDFGDGDDFGDGWGSGGVGAGGGTISIAGKDSNGRGVVDPFGGDSDVDGFVMEEEEKTEGKAEAGIPWVRQHKIPAVGKIAGNVNRPLADRVFRRELPATGTAQYGFRVDTQSDDFKPQQGQTPFGYAGQKTDAGIEGLDLNFESRWAGEHRSSRTGNDFIRLTGVAGETSNTATAGLRSGDFATTRESIDAILNNPNRTKAPLGTTGFITLDSGEQTDKYAWFHHSANGKANLGVDRSFLNPTEYEPPEVPNPIVSPSSSRYTDSVRYSIDADEGPQIETEAIRGNTSSIAKKEIVRRAGLVAESDRALVRGREAYAKGDYEEAAKQYRQAEALLPPGPATAERRRSYGQHLGDASVALAQQSRRLGKYEEARQLLQSALVKDPTNSAAKKQLEYLEDPIRTNPAITADHTKAVAEVRKGLYMGEGYYNLGQYDKAEAEMKKVLQKDPYNKAARRWLEKVAATKSDYYRAAYDHTRAALLKEVDKAWELAVPPAPSKPVAKPMPTIPAPVPADGQDGKLTELAQNLNAKNVDVDRLRKRLMDVAERTGLAYVETEDGGKTVDNVTALRDVAEKQLYDTEQQKKQLELQLNKLTQVSDDDLINLAAELPDVGFKEAHTKYENALARLQTLEARGLGEKHPDVTMQRVRVEEMEKGLKNRAVNVRQSLQHRLNLLNGQVENMKRVRNQGLEKARSMNELNTLRKEYEKARSLRDEMQAEFDLQRAKHGIDNAARTSGSVVAPPAPAQALPDETITRTTPFSTFSLNVADVSFKLAKVALLEQGKWPDAAKVRTEEFVNAFDYGDPSPQRGEPVSCAIEQAAHPFLQQRNLLRVGMKTASIGRSAPLRLTILLDNSGSMEREDREASVMAAMKVLASQLGPQDVITVVGFARTPRLLADRIRGDQAHKLIDIVAKTPSEGGTNIEEALKLARTLAKRQRSKGAQDRIVLITDGVANLGNTVPEELSDQIVALRQEGIAFDACGVGAEGLNDDILEAMTRKGDGRYYFLNRAEDADSGFVKQLAGALTPAAKNVKVQVKFNPDRVTRYRLLGFKKHRLKKEDFRNDKVDAAEMSAEEAGNAVYQIQVNPQGVGELGEVYVRFYDVKSGRMVERSWPLPYEPQAPSFDLAAPAMQLAGTAAMLGEKLHGTDAGSVRFQMISDTLNKLRGHYASDTRVQDLIRMCRKVK